MSISFANYEWEHLLHLVSDIYTANTLEDLFDHLCQDLAFPVLDFHSAACWRLNKKAGQRAAAEQILLWQDGGLADPAGILSVDDALAPWVQQMATRSSRVFLQSDITPNSTQLKTTHAYQKRWTKIDAHFALFLCIAESNAPYALFGFFRSEQSHDFDERDHYLANLLLEPLTNRLSWLLQSHKAIHVRMNNALQDFTRHYDLTRKEYSVMELLYQQKSTGEICDALFISVSTLNKHLSNIYRKTGVTNRTQLYMLLTGQT